MRALVAGLVVLGACSDDPVHKGKVTDRWGKPVAGAVIGFTGSSQQIVSGADGGFASRSGERRHGSDRQAGSSSRPKRSRHRLGQAAACWPRCTPTPSATGFMLWAR